MRRRPWLLVFDPAAVILFVAVGRDTHGEEAAVEGMATTAAPFLIALAVGWAAGRAWRHPVDLRPGAVVAAVTVALGMALRRLVFDEGTALAFVAVATAFLTLTMLGWRAIAARFAG